MKIRAFITHKKAEYFKDCQDRFSINSDTKSVAVSDGMSQSYQQKIWAEMLVKSYTESTDWEPSISSVREIAPQWAEGVRKYIQELKEIKAPQYLIIMNENALASRKSAGATFCGIRFNGNEWQGYVLGDSCLIEIVNNKIQHIYSSQQGEEFDNHPDYFDSNPLSDGKGTPLAIRGKIDKSTSVIIVSDPFSDFLNEKMKLGNEEEYIKRLLTIRNHDDFEALVADWRDNLGMHNDDSTLVIIEDDEWENFNVDPTTDVLNSFIAEEVEKEKKEEETQAQGPVTQEHVNEEPSLDSLQEVVEDESTDIIPSEINVQEKVHNEEDVLAKRISEEEFIKSGLHQYRELREKEKKGIVNAVKRRLGKPEDAIKSVLREIYKKFIIISK